MLSRWTRKAGSHLSEIQTRGQNAMKDFSNSIKLLASILIAVAIISQSSQINVWADVVAQPGFSIILLNDDLAGPDGLDFDSAGNIFAANAGAPNVFEHEDFISLLSKIVSE